MTHNLFTDNLTAKHNVIMQHDKSTFVETELFTSQKLKAVFGTVFRSTAHKTHPRFLGYF
jgi:hypothetical protein